MKKYCADKKYTYEIISDLGSGINYKKKGLSKLLKLIFSGVVSKIILTHKDRLVRFGYPLLEQACNYFNTKIEIIYTENSDSVEANLVSDVLEIMTVFTARLHGMRSHKNKKAEQKKII